MLTAALDAHTRALVLLELNLQLLTDLVVPDAEELRVNHVELAVLVQSEHLVRVRVRARVRVGLGFRVRAVLVESEHLAVALSKK